MKWFEKVKIWKLKRDISDLKTINHWAKAFSELQDKHIALLKSHNDLLDECISLKKELNGRVLVNVTK